MIKLTAQAGLLILAASLGAPDWAAAQAPAKSLVVFGTSLSDPGNAFALVGGTNTPPDYSLDDFLVPDKPYARGGHHFSDGETWIEQVARTWRLAAYASPAFRSASPKAMNFAVGGARARLSGPGHFAWQVDAFLAKTGGAAPMEALYIIEMGGNDVRDAFLEAVSGRDPYPILMEAAVAIRGQIERLGAAGAHRFFVWNVPDVGLTPAIRGTGAGGIATGLAGALNTWLAGELATIGGVEIRQFNAFVLVQEIFASPQAFGLREVNLPCIRPGEPPFHCKDPGRHLFWDGIHPTRAAHGVIAHGAAAALAAP